MSHSNLGEHAKLSREEVRYIINHVFLPPQLPHGDDYKVQHEETLLKIVIEALSMFRGYVEGHETDAVDLAITTMQHLHQSHIFTGSKLTVDEKGLLEAFQLLSQEGMTVACHVQAQNCAIMFSKSGTFVHVEMFELSASNQAVISTKGRLRRLFPGSAVSVPFSIFQTREFQDTLACTLDKMTHQSAHGAQPQVQKAKEMHEEPRDTTHPKMVTELFSAFLLSVGDRPEVTKIWKNTREEVFWSNSKLPWHRSALWLLIRVVLQLIFTRSSCSSSCPEHTYKAFMICFMAYVLERVPKDLPSDILVAMSAKVSRRYHKINGPIPGPMMDFVKSTLLATNQALRDRWSQVQEQNRTPSNLESLGDLNFDKDTHISPEKLVKFLDSIKARQESDHSVDVPLSCPLDSYNSSLLPSLASPPSNGDVMYRLAAFESWVASHLNAWTVAKQGGAETCRVLGYLIEDYYHDASSKYQGNPELNSIMILTILELWVASDKSARESYELLEEYKPGIPQSLFLNLNLPTRGQMARLYDVEKYLKDRESRAHFPYEALNSFGSDSCFSVRFFDQSPEHQELRASIVDQANRDREAKCEEFQRKTDEYKGLQLKLQNIKHTKDPRVNQSTGVCEDLCAWNCEKCAVDEQANSITINIHEWPLPSINLQEKSTIFELQVPCAFGQWRDTTVFVLSDVLKLVTEVRSQPDYNLKLIDYLTLRAHFKPFDPMQRQRIMLLSDTKPHQMTHRNAKNIATVVLDEVCLRNGLSFRYYDNSKDIFVSSFKCTDKLAHLCTYSLPKGQAGEMSPIQPFIHRVPSKPSGPSPNEVIATQSNCPLYISLEEYKALTSLPLGFLIQWQNILLQLISPSIDFKKEETALIISQCIYQVGPQKGHSVLRDSHIILADAQFSRALLDNLEKAFFRVKENWQSFQAHGIFVSIARRLLSLAFSQSMKDRCLRFLADIRKIASQWIYDLEDKIQRAVCDSTKDELRDRLTKIALICADTFNVEEEHLRRLLSVPDSACAMMRCSIVIHEGQNCIPEEPYTWTSIMHRRWERLSYRAFGVLAEVITNGSPALDDAIKKTWSAFPAKGEWTIQKEPHHHWIVNRSPLDSGDGALYVHFSLLTGKLLVNGSPLGRLPREYETDYMYSILFGKSILEVVPSPVPGMRFSAKNTFNTHNLDFGLDNLDFGLDKQAQTLLIRAVTKDQAFELVPWSVLRGSFPTIFVENFVHWYSESDDCIEFCPKEQPWTHSEDSWRLVRSGVSGKIWRLRKGNSLLVDFASDTTKAVFNTHLKYLEDVTWAPIIFQDNSLIIELPRLKLGFYLKQGETSIYSQQFRGMSIDEDQSIGTLVGLQRGKLVLKGNNNRVRRKVLISNGNVTFKKHDKHICVSIDKQSSTKVYTYDVDGLIGRLGNNGNLQGRLLLSYLHALTSFPLPDPLTRKTGTEEALSILKSAAVRSFIRLTEDNLGLLEKIALLTPARRYYPANLTEMQVVDWNSDLGFLAQHSGFYQTVFSIFRQANESAFFDPSSYVSPPVLHKVEESLLLRDDIRSSTFRVSGYGAESHTTCFDKVYQPRDNNQSSKGAYRAFSMSRIVLQDQFSLSEIVEEDLGGYLWNFLSEHDIHGPKSTETSSQSVKLTYDSGLLLNPARFVAEHWIRIHQALVGREAKFNKFKVMLWLSTLAFSDDTDMKIMQVLASFFKIPGMAAISPPEADIFQLPLGFSLGSSTLNKAIDEACFLFWESPEAKLETLPGENDHAAASRRCRAFETNKSNAAINLKHQFELQWPCESPIRPPYLELDGVEWWRYIHADQAVHRMAEIFRPRYHNHLFMEYLNQISHSVPRGVFQARIPTLSSPDPGWNRPTNPGFISNEEVFIPAAPAILPCIIDDMTQYVSLVGDRITEKSNIPRLLLRLDEQMESEYERRYVSDLKNSAQSLQGFNKSKCLTKNIQEIEGFLICHRGNCQKVVDETYNNMVNAIISDQGSEQFTSRALLASTYQWPRLSPCFFLQHLCQSRWQNLRNDWKNCIVHYAVAISQLQRADRLLNALNNRSILISELANPGHTNWQPRDYPESLLLEIEGDLMIRPVQEQIAKTMRSSEGDKNAVMQLNMGEGKSSVIVPMVATALADGSRLVRVIVGKPQSKQMYQMLISKLGGLLDRRIYHLPFSRAVKVGGTEIQQMRTMLEDCKRDRGIFLLQPEHILSFKLMGIECMLTGKEAIGRPLVESQEYLNANARDIVDESDENFSVKFELVYTMGAQRPTQYSPERWVCIHHVLDVVKEVVLESRAKLSDALEVYPPYHGRFPRTRILQRGAADQILAQVTERICKTGFTGFPIIRQREHIRQAIIRYITEAEPSIGDIALVEDTGLNGFWTGASEPLLLLRGLIAGGVLGFTLGHKRWRVDYGLDPNRQPNTQLAVPYRAKDNPSLRSEFSHPDVVIILTSLCYYYGGLSYEDLLQTFKHLVRSYQADQEFGVWVKDANDLSENFKTLVGINLEDSECTQSLFRSFRHAKGVIDYFLAHLVFPKEMKEFPNRLSASGWDIGEVKTHKMTGFSGTNDSRQVLPLDVKQLDLKTQKHTNALVLDNLLRPENSVTLLPPRQESEKSVAEVLLNTITKLDPPTRVILDVGAQILELDNFEVARTWLQKTSDDTQIEAAIFVDDHDEICVLDRKGHFEPLHTSSFASRLDVCVVFLDEAHTRGTDLKLARNYRAAVTLGANLTKDRLVQACMRMRMLGEGQSVVFCVPDEIQRKIRAWRADAGLPKDEDISVLDILDWSIGETWRDIHKNMALWAKQGRRNIQHKKIWADARSDQQINLTKALAERYLEDEAKTLDYRYRPRGDINTSSQPADTEATDPITLRCKEFKNLRLDSADLQEEEERELSPEIEQEREDQRPPPAEPAMHKIHDDIKRFVEFGTIREKSTGYMPAFLSLRDTSSGASFDVSQFRTGLLVSSDFANTVKRRSTSDQLDSYQRAIQWILTSTPLSDEDSADRPIKYMMVISPFEANDLLPLIEKSNITALHIYAPRANSSYPNLDKLDLYTVPEKLASRKMPQSLITELNLFAGQLYFSSYEEYVGVCRFLGISYSTPGEEEEITAEGFIAKDSAGRIGGESGLRSSPVTFFKILHTKIRRNCESIEKTHMGKLLGNQLLKPQDFE
ncbi:uncharacterized protein F4812DRAFT_440689 [Daldinia caldariorum]|uniref:uncharacterized protein n=1 Tax=Daldinia caldariorum TaxID=326644 RepID=UPI002008A6BE|nr:uncharacterized protein F4812DRAFT_440689 [Daldinia caldariorum]KAI1464850.1 hypothetical protein F4812DRAFT_440689 [Daldinia caldariorum]